jgi:hypothetical protein
VQALPFGLRSVQDVPAQVNPLAQSTFDAQVTLQAPSPHTYLPQVMLAPATQFPAPLHTDPAVNVDPVQVALPQLVPTVTCMQAPAPLQRPVFPQGGVAAQRAWGSAPPAATTAQVPLLPATLHAWQVPHDAVLQQTPSVQEFPVRQSALVVQIPPSGLKFPHLFVVRSQIVGATHSASEVHVMPQMVPLALHLNGAHDWVALAEQLPMPSQAPARVAVEVPAGHDGGRHCTPAAYF